MKKLNVWNDDYWRVYDKRRVWGGWRLNVMASAVDDSFTPAILGNIIPTWVETWIKNGNRLT